MLLVSKSKFRMLKNIFSVIIGTLVLSGIFAFVFANGNKEGASMVLRVAFPYVRAVNEYEPTKIYFSPEYTFLENTFSPLVELSPEKGDVVGGISDDFHWKGSELIFHIRDGLTTVDGYKITADDAAFSLKRLLLLSGNTHGNFKDLVCGVAEVKTIDSPCKGIRVSGNNLILETKGVKSFLLPMLAAIDFAVIPKRSVDLKTLAITDYRNTTGAYYVQSDDQHGNIVLKANPSHFHYSKQMAQEIKLVPSGLDGLPDSRKQFLDNKVDFITTIDKLNPEKLIDFAEDHNAVLHSTMNLRTFILIFTKKGIKKYSADQRLSMGKTLKTIFREHFLKSSGYAPTDQLFPSYGDGYLSDDEAAKLHKQLETVLPSQDVGNARIAVLRIGDISEFKSKIETTLKGSKVFESSDIPALTEYKNEDDEPEMFIAGPDTGFLEDIGLISYSINVGLFGLEKNAGEKWLKEYMAIESKDQRMIKLRKLHIETLESGVAIPLVSAPYVAVARKGWSIGYSQLFSNDLLWRILKN